MHVKYLDKLNSEKARGNDGLSAEHVVHVDRRISVLLSIYIQKSYLAGTSIG